MENTSTVTAFAGQRRLAAGTLLDVALAVRAAMHEDASQSILAFDDRTGRQVDFDLRGSATEIAARLASQSGSEGGPVAQEKRSGRPKLGVVAREVTLLPRHWQWLAAQPGGASVTLRKLVDAARHADNAPGAVRQAQQAADRFMSAMLGNAPGYEDAARALYAGDRQRFLDLSAAWPADLRDHARRLAAPALPDIIERT